MWKNADAEAVHGYDVRGGCGTWEAVGESSRELCVVVRYEDADAERTEDEESREAVEDCVEGLGHDFAWVLGFARCHRDVVWSGDGEGGLDQALEETEKVAEISAVVEWFEGAWIVPVSEAESIAQRVSAEHDDESEDDETDDEKHLAERSPELDFAVPFYIHQVDQGVEDDADCYDGAGWNGAGPIAENNIAGGDLEGDEDGFKDEEIPSV